MGLSQVDFVRWKLLRENDQHRIVGTAIYFKISAAEALRRLFTEFGGDITAFERAALIYAEQPDASEDEAFKRALDRYNREYL